MKVLPKSNRNLISQMLASGLSFGLFAYFCFHLLHGDMGYFALRGVDQKLAETQDKYDHLLADRTALENRVRLLRPSSLDPDMLDERARVVLGFAKVEEREVVQK
jgi:cell division protein FtsB